MHEINNRKKTLPVGQQPTILAWGDQSRHSFQAV